MPYVEDKETVFLEEDGYKLSYINWRCEGQCVTMYPPTKFRVDFGHVQIDIIARSQHKARQIALDIAELFKGSV